MKKIIIALLLCFNWTIAQASFIPVGVQNDVAIDTVVNDWGWNQIYRDDYGSSVSIDNAFAGHGKYVMLGAIFDNSASISVLAAVLWDDFITYTARNVTHEANGAQWYNNGGSLGFAGLGDSINQNSADTNTTNGNLRLSWHTSGGYSSLANSINGGWRAGNSLGLNNSTAWDRVIFTADDINLSPVPVPAAAWLFGSALLGFFGFSRKKANT